MFFSDARWHRAGKETTVRRTIFVTALVAAFLPVGGPAVSAVAHGPAVVRHLGHASAASLNWSGYSAFASGTTFTDVKASWVAPSVSCPSGKGQYSSFWVGIDGYNSNSVEQTGT